MVHLDLGYNPIWQGWRPNPITLDSAHRIQSMGHFDPIEGPIPFFHWTQILLKSYWNWASHIPYWMGSDLGLGVLSWNQTNSCDSDPMVTITWIGGLGPRFRNPDGIRLRLGLGPGYLDKSGYPNLKVNILINCIMGPLLLCTPWWGPPTAMSIRWGGGKKDLNGTQRNTKY